MGKLTAEQVRRLDTPGRYTDGGGLCLVVTPAKTKQWVLRLMYKGKRTDKGLGGYPTLALRRAREIADDTRAAVKSGIPLDPPKAKGSTPAPRRKGKPSFENVARNVHQVNVEAGVWCEQNAVNWIKRAERHLFPMIGKRAIDDIPVAVLRDDLLRPIAKDKPETGKRLRIILRQTFEQALEDGLIEVNPVDRLPLKRLNRAIPTHRRALPYQDVPAAIVKLRRYRGIEEGNPPWKATLLCFEFMMLNAARPGEARGATWEEIDLDAKTWTIPAGRMKARREHKVPLSERAEDILIEARELGKGKGLIFPNPKTGGALSPNTLDDRAEKEGFDAVPHGFRSSFRDWMAECTDASWAVAEACLAHKVGNATEAAYMRSDLLELRRPIMQAWSDYVTPEGERRLF